MTFGNALKDQLVSIATTLDHCHVPGRAEHAQLDETTIEIGTGPHNEPGYVVVNPQPAPEELVDTLIKYLTDESDPDRGYVHFDKEDEVALLINNFGGMSNLEMGALTNEFLDRLPAHINPVRVYTGMFETSLNAPAFALTICNLTATAKKSGVAVKQILQFLDERTDSAWESVAGEQRHPQRRPRKEQILESPMKEAEQLPDIPSLKGKLSNSTNHNCNPLISQIVDPKTLSHALRIACDRVIACEPSLTKWDTIMGDGDCGETFKTGCTEMLKELDSGLADSGSLLSVLAAISHITETKMGGTLGAILSIYFNAFTSELARTKDLRTAPARACRLLEGHTSARNGHRTIMDVLIPVVDEWEKSGDLAAVKKVAIDGAEGTKKLKPLLGRATYVAGKETGELPPDPGAWGAMELVGGLVDGLSGR